MKIGEVVFEGGVIGRIDIERTLDRSVVIGV